MGSFGVPTALYIARFPELCLSMPIYMESYVNLLLSNYQTLVKREISLTTSFTWFCTKFLNPASVLKKFENGKGLPICCGRH